MTIDEMVAVLDERYGANTWTLSRSVNSGYWVARTLNESFIGPTIAIVLSAAVQFVRSAKAKSADVTAIRDNTTETSKR